MTAAASVPALRPGVLHRLGAVRPSRTIAPLLLLAGASLVVLTYFDLGPPLAFGDDWGMAWETRWLIAHHQLRIFPEQSALAVFQAFWAWLVTLGHPDQRLLRLTSLPFVGLGVTSAYRLSRELGADRFWAGVAGLCLATGPIYLAAVATFQTEAFYIGALMAAAYAGVRWLRDSGHGIALVAWSSVAGLERQHAVAIPMALTAVLLLRRRRPTRAQLLVLGATWVALIVIEVGPLLLGLATPVMRSRIASVASQPFAFALLPFVYLPPVVGLLCWPFLPALARGRRGVLIPAAGSLAALTLAGLGVAFAGICFAQNCSIFPGTTSIYGLYVFGLAGSKPALVPALAWTAIEAMAVASFLVLLIARRANWAPRVLGAEGVPGVARGGSRCAHDPDAPARPLLPACRGGTLPAARGLGDSDGRTFRPRMGDRRHDDWCCGIRGG